jgi:hypothetical protein
MCLLSSRSSTESVLLQVGSLVKESMAVLMQRTPKQLDNVLVDCYQKVMQLEGVQGVQVKKNNIYLLFRRILSNLYNILGKNLVQGYLCALIFTLFAIDRPSFADQQRFDTPPDPETTFYFDSNPDPKPTLKLGQLATKFKLEYHKSTAARLLNYF